MVPDRRPFHAAARCTSPGDHVARRAASGSSRHTTKASRAGRLSSIWRGVGEPASPDRWRRTHDGGPTALGPRPWSRVTRPASPDPRHSPFKKASASSRVLNLYSSVWPDWRRVISRAVLTTAPGVTTAERLMPWLRTHFCCSTMRRWVSGGNDLSSDVSTSRPTAFRRWLRCIPPASRWPGALPPAERDRPIPAPAADVQDRECVRSTRTLSPLLIQ